MSLVLFGLGNSPVDLEALSTLWNKGSVSCYAMSCVCVCARACVCMCVCEWKEDITLAEIASCIVPDYSPPN